MYLKLCGDYKPGLTFGLSKTIRFISKAGINIFRSFTPNRIMLVWHCVLLLKHLGATSSSYESSMCVQKILLE